MTPGIVFDFEVICLPRSGSLWMANFLSSGFDSICIHEPQTIVGFSLSQLSDYRSVGCSSSASIVQPVKSRKRIYIDRHPEEAWESYKGFTNLVNWEQFEAWCETYYGLPRNAESLTVKYENLTDTETCGKVWQFLFGRSMPLVRLMECRRMKVTVLDHAIDEIKLVERPWEQL